MQRHIKQILTQGMRRFGKAVLTQLIWRRSYGADLFGIKRFKCFSIFLSSSLPPLCVYVCKHIFLCVWGEGKCFSLLYTPSLYEYTSAHACVITCVRGCACVYVCVPPAPKSTVTKASRMSSQLRWIVYEATATPNCLNLLPYLMWIRHDRHV